MDNASLNQEEIYNYVRGELNKGNSQKVALAEYAGDKGFQLWEVKQVFDKEVKRRLKNEYEKKKEIQPPKPLTASIGDIISNEPAAEVESKPESVDNTVVPEKHVYKKSEMYKLVEKGTAKGLSIKASLKPYADKYGIMIRKVYDMYKYWERADKKAALKEPKPQPTPKPVKTAQPKKYDDAELVEFINKRIAEGVVASMAATEYANLHGFTGSNVSSQYYYLTRRKKRLAEERVMVKDLKKAKDETTPTTAEQQQPIVSEIEIVENEEPAFRPYAKPEPLPEVNETPAAATATPAAITLKPEPPRQSLPSEVPAGKAMDFLSVMAKTINAANQAGIDFGAFMSGVMPLFTAAAKVTELEGKITALKEREQKLLKILNEFDEMPGTTKVASLQYFIQALTETMTEPIK